MQGEAESTPAPYMALRRHKRQSESGESDVAARLWLLGPFRELLDCRLSILLAARQAQHGMIGAESMTWRLGD